MKKGFGSIVFAYSFAVIGVLSAIITSFFNGTDFTVSFKVGCFDPTPQKCKILEP